MEARTRRQLAMLEARRAMVVDAAVRVADRVGLQRASIREIAKEAGYTPGALYAFFRNKGEVLVVLARQAIDQLGQAVQAARVPKGQEAQALMLKGDAWMAHLIQHPRDWEVIAQVVLGPLHKDLDTEQVSGLHRALRDTLAQPAQILVDQGLPSSELDQELEAMLSMALGVLVAQDSTRLQPPALAAQQLFSNYLSTRMLALRAINQQSVDVGSDLTPKGKKQVDLFG